MRIDTDQTFAQLYPDPQVLHNHLQKLQTCILGRDQSRQWAQNLRFIATTTKLSGVDVDSEECCCAQKTSFMGQEDSTVFKVTAPGAYRDCTHYVAVSWCWRSSSQSESPSRQYWIETGASKRLCSVPAHIMSRTIKFAAREAIPFLWIDKECIDQNNRNDKEFGIQSMDLVYQRSCKPLCLLECYFSTQSQIDVFAMLIEGRDPPADQIATLIEVLEMFKHEQSFTRAWILQETVSAGLHMDLMIQHDPRLSKPPIMGDIDGEIIIMLDEFLLAVYFAFSVPDSDDHLDVAQCNKLRQIVDNIVAYHPAHITELKDVGEQSWITFADPEYRQTCNAAQALTYLALRKNSRVPDRIAILANLCDYKIRLDTSMADHLGLDFSICAFALAIFNGDLSLTSLVQHSSQSTSSFSWVPTGDIKLQSLLRYEDSAVIIRTDLAQATAKGLFVYGWLWKLNSTFTHRRVRELDRDSMTATDIIWARMTLIAVLLRIGYVDLARCLYIHSTIKHLFCTWPFRRSKLSPAQPTDTPPRRLSEVFDTSTGDIVFRAEGLVENESEVRVYLDKRYSKESAGTLMAMLPLNDRRWFDEATLRGRGLPLATLANSCTSDQNHLESSESKLTAQITPSATFDVQLEIENTGCTESPYAINHSTKPVYVFVPSTALDSKLAISGWVGKPVGWIVETPDQCDADTGCRILRGTKSTCRGFWTIPTNAQAEKFLLQ